MYQNACGCQSNGLGFVTEALSLASDVFGGGGGGGGGAAPITVSPAITTQISPQISPVFQQQFQPTNSAATAGTAQSVPAMPGGSPVGNTVGVPGYSSPAVPMVPQTGTDWTRYMPYALAGLGILAFVSMRKRKVAR